MTDRDFEKYLEGDSSLSRAYRASATDNPPASIDRAVRDALAAERTATATQRSRIHEWHRYLVPMAAAATVVLSFSLVMQLVLDPSGEGMRMDDSIAMSGRAAKKVASAEELNVADAPSETIDALGDAVAQAEPKRSSVAAAPAPSVDTPVADSAGDTSNVDDVFAAAPPVASETVSAGAQADQQSNTPEHSDEAYAPEPPVLASRDEPDTVVAAADMAESEAAEDAYQDAAIARETREAMAKTETEARARVSSEGDVIDDALSAGEPTIVASNRDDVNAIDTGHEQADMPAAEAKQAPSAGGLAMESAPAPGVAAAGSTLEPQLAAEERVCRFERDERLVRATSVESRIEVARYLVEIACANEARELVQELSDDEPGLDLSEYSDLVELMEDE